MFARDKRIGPYTYVYLVENVREEGRTKAAHHRQSRRKEVVVGARDLDRLARSVGPAGAAFDVLSLVEGGARPMQGVSGLDRRCCSSGCGMKVGCRAVLEELAAAGSYAFAAERAVFLTVPPPAVCVGSDRAAEKCEPTTGSRALRPFSCIISTAPWFGSASRSPIKPEPAS